MGIYSQTLDGSYTEKIKAVYEHLGEIKKVADRLSPVEDLQDFKGQIEQLHSRLDLIVEASNIIVATSQVGESVITAPSWTALRNLLGLEEFPTDVVYIDMLNAALDALWQRIQGLVGGITFEIPSGILGRLNELERLSDVLVLDITHIQTTNSAFSSLVFGLQQSYSDLNGDVNFVQSSLSSLHTSFAAHGDSLTALASNYDVISQKYENLESGVSVVNGALSGIESRLDIHGNNIAASSTAITSLTTSVNLLDTKTTANANAIDLIETSISHIDGQFVAMAQHITELEVDLTTEYTTAISTAVSSLTVLIEQNENGISAVAEDVTELETNILSDNWLLQSSAFHSLHGRVGINDGLIQANAEDIISLQSTVKKKNRTFVQGTQPISVAPDPPLVNGDLWINTSNNNEIKTYLNGNWVLREIAGGARTHVGPNPPSGTHRVGDLWFDTSENNRMNRWNGTAWVVVEDPRISANAQAVNNLRTDVFDGPNGLTAIAENVRDLQADVGDHTGQITEAMSVAVRALEGNYVVNPSFEEDGGWGSAADGTGNYPTGMSRTFAGAHTGNWGLTINASTSQSQLRRLYNKGRMRVSRDNDIQIGCRYRKSTTASFSGNVRFALRLYNASGNYIGEDELQSIVDWQTSHKLHLTYYTVPQNVSEVQLVLKTSGSSETYYIDDVFLKNLSVQEAEVIASHTLDLNVNGYVSGTRNINDGTTASFKILADVFSVEKPGGGAKMEWVNEGLRMYDQYGQLRIKIGVR